MIQTRKTIWKMFNIISLLLALCVLLSSCLINMPTMKLPFETTPSESELNEFRLSNKICVTLFGIDSQTFYETKGKDTLLENGYTKASITDDILVLYLTDEQVDSWRNSNIFLQILQNLHISQNLLPFIFYLSILVTIYIHFANIKIYSIFYLNNVLL